MISPFIRVYIANSARKLNKTVNKRIDKVLHDELKQFSFVSEKILYSWFWSAGVYVPNASATIPGLILVNAEWAARIVLTNDDEYMHDAFRMTIYHEIMHHENDFSFWGFVMPDRKFVNWTNEVHADFGGIQKAFNGDVTRAIHSMEYKRSCKKKPDMDSRGHPSWNRRIRYISDYDFDSILIKRIAVDTGCADQKLIDAVIDHFEEIKLKRKAGKMIRGITS